jgi:LysM repeat protein
MERRTSAPARIAAALALAVAVVAVVVVVAGSTGSSDGGGGHHRHHRHRPHQKTSRHVTQAKTYVVQTGDTLIAISEKTGVPVSEILALNPEVDPQILIAGETLKLR